MCHFKYVHLVHEPVILIRNNLPTDVTFIPFGTEEGDNEATVMNGDIISLDPLILETPLVFYLQQEYQLHVSSYCVSVLLCIHHRLQ